MQCLNQHGQQLGWHFDRSEFTTTLLLQAPTSGGEFLYRKDLRSANNPNYEGVAEVITHETELASTLNLEPCTLNVFKGQNTPHKVNAVKGKRNRIISVFSFFEKEGVRFSDEDQDGFYGKKA